MKHTMMLICLVLACSLPAYGVIEPSRRDTYDSGCVVNMSTSGCFDYGDPTATKFVGPTVTACVARGDSDQRCRECRWQFNDEGQYLGYSICAFMPKSASCECKNPKTPQCYGSGACEFK
jgi:hypothetical protein